MTSNTVKAVYKVQPAEDENGKPLYTLHYRGFHVIFNEPLTFDEETEFKRYLDHVRNVRKDKDGRVPA